MNTSDPTPPNRPEDEAAAGAQNDSRRVTVMIVEDDDGTREAVARWIEATEDFQLLGHFADPRAALKRIIKEQPDVVLADVNMPGLSGIELVGRAKPACPETQFVMLTIYGDTDHIFQALTAGASGYLLKSTLREELTAAVREVMHGGSPMTSDVARKVVQSFHPQEQPAQQEYTLSDREKTVLDRLAMGFLYKEIAAELGVSVTTVSTYVRRIYVKLQVRSRAQAVAKVMIKK